jgi:hypothetical protein
MTMKTAAQPAVSRTCAATAGSRADWALAGEALTIAARAIAAAKTGAGALRMVSILGEVA